MRQTIKLLMLIAIAMTSTVSALAQNNPERKSKEELAQLHAKHIAVDLGLDEATTKRFTETFCSLQKQVWEIEAKPTRVTEQMTDEQAEQAIKARFDHSQRILDIRRNGYNEYRKFLTPKQIERVYRLEKKDMQRTAGNKKSAPAKGGNKGPRGKQHRK